MNFYSVKVCKLTDIKGYDCIGRLVADKYETCICVIDSSYSVVKNIKTGEIFPILKNDNYSKFISIEKSKINTVDRYAIEVRCLKALTSVERLELKVEYLRFQIREHKNEQNKRKQKIIKR